MNIVGHSRRFAVRYSIALILFLMACAAGFLSGYRNGFSVGENIWYSGATYTETYNVADLVRPTPSFDARQISVANFDDLIAVVAPIGPDLPSDRFAIRPFPTQLSLVVTGNRIIHRRVQTLLQNIRKPKPPGDERG